MGRLKLGRRLCTKGAKCPQDLLKTKKKKGRVFKDGPFTGGKGKGGRGGRELPMERGRRTAKIDETALEKKKRQLSPHLLVERKKRRRRKKKKAMRSSILNPMIRGKKRSGIAHLYRGKNTKHGTGQLLPAEGKGSDATTSLLFAVGGKKRRKTRREGLRRSRGIRVKKTRVKLKPLVEREKKKEEYKEEEESWNGGRRTDCQEEERQLGRHSFRFGEKKKKEEARQLEEEGSRSAACPEKGEKPIDKRLPDPLGDAKNLIRLS